jgi:acyl carrier protein
MLRFPASQAVNASMTIRARITRVVAERLGQSAAQLGDSASFLQSGVADSLKLMALLEAIEAEFQVTAEPGDFTPENFDSLDGITQYLATKGLAG